MGGVRTPSIRGAFTVSIWRGIPTLKGRKGKKYVTPALGPLQTQGLFIQAAEAAKRITPQEYKFAVDTTKASQYLWRDVYYMALYGRLFTFIEQDRGQWVSVAARNTMSQSLDALGSQKSGILVRGTTWWDVLAPGPAGYVLVSQGPFEPLAWAPQGGGGGGSYTYANLQGSAVGSSNFASKGNILNVLVPVAINQIAAQAIWPGGGSFQITAWSLIGNMLDQLLASSDIKSPAAATDFQVFTMDQEVEILPGAPVAVILSRHDAGNTYNLRLYQSSQQFNNWPTGISMSKLDLAKALPASGDIFTPFNARSDLPMFWRTQ